MFCKRRILGLAAGTAALIGVAISATAGFAADFTLKKPLEMVIGNAPGGAMDRLARLTDLYLKSQKLIPNESIVLPKPGGGHAVALAYIKSHAKDPSRLMAVNTLLISNNLLGRSELKYSDFTPLAILYEEPMMFAVKYDSQIKDGADLAKRLKADPTSVSFSVSSGLGTANHMAAILLAKAVGANIRAVKAVSFESGSEGITSVLGGHVDVVVTPPGSMMQFIETKQLRFIAVAGDHRAEAPLADIPTWKEIGYDVSVSAWRGVIGPPGLKPEEIDFWQKGFEGFMKSDEYKKSAKEEIFEARYLNAADSAKFLADMDAQFRDYLTLVGAAQSK